MHELALHHTPGSKDGKPNKVRVEYRADGSTQPQTAEIPFTFDYDPKDRRLVQWYLEEYFTCPWGEYRNRAVRAEQTIRDLGERLFKAVFSPEETRDLYAEVRQRLPETRVVVHAASSAGSALPWEFLYDAKLGAAGAIVQQARSFIRSRPNVPRLPWATDGSGPLHVLLVICRPAGPDQDVPFQSVARPLVNMLCREEMKDRVTLTVLRPPTFLRLSQELLGNPGKYHVVHFDGHGTFADLPPGHTAGPQFINQPGLQGYLAFEDEDPNAEQSRLVTGAEFGAILAQAKVPVVLLNACQSGKEQEVSAYPSVGNQLLDAGVRGVVAMAFSVLVESAKRFMHRLYEGLLNGEELGHAVQLARADLFASPRRHGSPVGPLDLRDWMVPVVFQTADTVLTKPRQKLTLSLDAPEADGVGQAYGCPEPPEFGLVGRDGVMLELERAFRSDQLVVLEGMAGIGKTEAALGFAQWLARTGGLNGPVFFHAFGTHTTLDRVVGDIGRAFNATIRNVTRQDWGQITDADQRRNLVRQILRQVPCLLIWDNVEPVAGFPFGTPSDWSADEQLELRRFLHDLRGGATFALLTSRRDETGWLGSVFRKLELRGLPRWEAEELAERVLTRAGVSLPQLEDYTPLLAYLQGNPLAIQAILPELKTRKPLDLLRDLQTGEVKLPADDAALGRQRSLAASLGYRLDKLDPLLRQKLGMVALFQGVVGAGILSIMDDLGGAPGVPRGRSRQQWDATLRQATEVGLLRSLGRDYYAVHPAVPWFLSDLLEASFSGQRSQLEARYAAAYALFSEATVKLFDQHSEVFAWVLRVEDGNLRHALALAERLGRWNSTCDVLEALSRLMHLDGRWTEWERILTYFERVTTDPGKASGAPQVGRERLWRTVLGLRAKCAEQRQDYSLLCQLSERLARVARERGDRRNEAVSLRHLGIAALGRGKLDEAERLYQESLRLDELVGNDTDRAHSLHELGRLADNRGELDKAERLYQESLEIWQRLEDIRGQISTLHQLGNLAFQHGDLDAAARYYNTCLNNQQALGDDPGKARSLYQLGMIAFDRRQLDEAEQHYRESLGITELIGDTYGRAHPLYGLGCVAYARGDLSEAEGWYRECLKIEEQQGDEPGRARTYYQLGLIAEDRKQTAKAYTYFVQAEQIFEGIGDARGLAFVRKSLQRVQPS
jgi:tetratricopeptide (TPR) repeat protein